MRLSDPEHWSDHLRLTLRSYSDNLVRQVAGRLIKPRGQWPVEELIERVVATADNAVVVDRRLQDLEPPGRRLLSLVARSRQPCWRLGSVLELLVAVGSSDGLRSLFDLFESGLLFPDLARAQATSRKPARLHDFEQWLGQSSAAGLTVFAHPQVMERALNEDLGLSELPAPVASNATSPPLRVLEADGLEWPLRLAALWQQTAAAPLRRTQQGDFYKRDLDRLRGDPLLNGPPAEGLGELPDAGLLAVALAKAAGVLEESDGELRTAATLPPAWEHGLPATLTFLWASLPHLEEWSPIEGWRGSHLGGNPYPAAYLLALLLLGHLPGAAWAEPAAVERWVIEHHPYWQTGTNSGARSRSGRGIAPVGIAAFLLGGAFQLRFLQVMRGEAGEWLIRLSPLGRWLLGFAEPPAPATVYTQTLLVQPNLEIVAYRQGLTPGLIADLSRFATWKSLGAACTLQLQPESVYRGLESGHTFETMLQTLERHGMRPTPPAVVESLRTWANKRERISIYPAATLFEFAAADELNEALARGLPAVRIAERLALVAEEKAIDFRHYRLTGTRDYVLPPDKCVEVEADGVTLLVDLARSDLFLETELQRFAEGEDRATANGRRLYRLTPASLQAARNSGLGIRDLEDWFAHRTGRPLSPAARLLLAGAQLPLLALRRELVLHVDTPEIADGLLQWPGTRSLIQARLGPTALTVAEEHAEILREKLRLLGVSLGG
jgi:hypothetical protein